MGTPESNLAVVYLAGTRGWEDFANGRTWRRLDCLGASLKLLRLFAPAFPVVVFHEDLLPGDMAELEAAAGREIRFESVDFSGHEAEYVPSSRYAGRPTTYGYRMMTRFFCGVMQAHPALDGFDHYMRLDDDSYLLRPIPDAAVERMLSADYTFASTCEDPRPDITAAATDFLRDRGHRVRPLPLAVPYNNYHTASLRLWRDPLVVEFMRGAQANCLSEAAWNDAPVHRELIAQFCPALGYSVHRERELSYRHNQHCSHPGEHTPYCTDGTGGEYPWGHPVV